MVIFVASSWAIPLSEIWELQCAVCPPLPPCEGWGGGNRADAHSASASCTAPPCDVTGGCRDVSESFLSSRHSWTVWCQFWAGLYIAKAGSRPMHCQASVTLVVVSCRCWTLIKRLPRHSVCCHTCADTIALRSYCLQAHH